MTFARRLAKMDPRWIWGIVMLIVWASVLAPIALPVPVTSGTRATVTWIDSLPKGKILLMAPEYNPGPDIELTPQLQAVAQVAFEHGLKIIVVTSGFQLGPQLATPAIEAAAKAAGVKLQYGVNFVNLGYKPGNSASENELVHSFQQATAGVDINGQPLSSFPLTKNIKTLGPQNFAGIWTEETGTPGCIDWYTNAAVPAGLTLGCGAITMDGPTDEPYYTAGQYKALLIGARGAGELEEVLHTSGLGLASQETATFASLLILLCVIGGNIVYYKTRKKAA
jgi:hypothetical protein